MKHDMRKIREWAAKVGDKLVHPVLEVLDKTAAKRTDEEVMEICTHVVTAMVYRMVTDSLSIRASDMKSHTDEELREIVSDKFGHMKLALESGVVTAFEAAMSEATRQDLEYSCKISRVADPVNNLPC